MLSLPEYTKIHSHVSFDPIHVLHFIFKTACMNANKNHMAPDTQ